MTRRHIIILQVLAVLACAALLAGCGGSSDDDEGGSGSGATKVNEEDLDLGAYEAEAGDVRKTAGDLPNGRAVEAQRLAEFILDPASLDDRFQEISLPSGAMASPSELTRLFASEDPDLFKDRISGAAAGRRFPDAGGDALGITICVLSYKDAATAARVARAIGEGNASNKMILGSLTYGAKTSLPGHPDVRTSFFRTSLDDAEPSLNGVVADGDLVVFMYMSGRDVAKLGKPIMAQAFTAQRTLLEGFEPTPLEETPALPVDEEGLTKLVLDRGEGDPDDQEPDVPRIWGPRAAMFQQTWVGSLPEAFERAELDALVQSSINLYRTGSAKQAKRLLEDFDETVTIEQYRPHNAPKGLRDANCYELVDDESSILAPNFCLVQYGRYLAEASGTSAEDAEARISAQYLLLQRKVG